MWGCVVSTGVGHPIVCCHLHVDKLELLSRGVGVTLICREKDPFLQCTQKLYWFWKVTVVESPLRPMGFMGPGMHGVYRTRHGVCPVEQSLSPIS